MRRALRLLVSLPFVTSAGCSFLVDASEIDRGCPPGEKLCGEELCVRVDDPAYGCRPTSCTPCTLDNAIPVCDGERCAVSACLFGFGCPNELGCEFNILTDRLHCGSCDTMCAAAESCQDGQCVLN